MWRLETLGYPVALAIVGLFASHLIVLGSEAAPLGGLRWRYGVLGVTFSSLAWLLVAFTALVLSAVAMGQFRVLRMLQVLAWFLAVVLAAGLVLFVLDFLQLRAMVGEPVQLRIVASSIRASLIATCSLTILIIFARALTTTTRALDTRNVRRSA